LLRLRTGKSTDGSENRSVSDAQLSERLKQKDQLAFLDLYDCYQRPVYRFLMHMTGSVTIAEDLTQEVFVVILDSMCGGTVGQFDPAKGTLEGYLLGVARNLARAEWRRSHRLLSLDNVVETLEWERLLNTLFRENGPWDIAALMSARSEVEFLHRAIFELPDHYRAAVVLCSLLEKSYREAAAILRCSEGTIASRVNRAKALLAAKLLRSAPDQAKGSARCKGKEGSDVGAKVKTNRR
jgi:RNA polymerase sigma-70 factor (ECF subfamily)